MGIAGREGVCARVTLIYWVKHFRQDAMNGGDFHQNMYNERYDLRVFGGPCLKGFVTRHLQVLKYDFGSALYEYGDSCTEQCIHQFIHGCKICMLKLS